MPQAEKVIQQLVSELANSIRAPRRSADIPFPEFYRIVLGLDMPAFQRSVIEEVLSAREVVFIAPPGHAKTTLVCTLAAWFLGRNPNLRIIIATHTISYSESLLSFIEAIMRSDQFVELFGQLCPPYGTVGWTSDEKTVIRPNPYIKDPSLKALGVGSSTIGYRADLVIADDLVTFSNSQTPVMRRHVSDWFWSNLYPRLEPNGRIIVIGARFYAQDLYSELLAKFEKRFVFRSSPEKPLWPERFGPEYLEKLRKQNYFAFMAQYEQHPLDLEASTLQESWLQYYIARPEHLVIYQGVDPCAQADSGDFFVIATVGLDSITNTAYILDILRRKASMEEQVDLIRREYERWKPAIIGVESNAAQVFLAERLEAMHLPIQRIYNELPKPVRIMSMASHFKSGRVLLPGAWSESGYVQPQPFIEPFLEEWRSFGSRSTHDDVLDAVDIALQVAFRISVPPAVSTSSQEAEAAEEDYTRPVRPIVPMVFDRRAMFAREHL